MMKKRVLKYTSLMGKNAPSTVNVGAVFTVGGALFTVGGAEFSVEEAVFTVGGACLQ